ncbi:Holin of 3TMs, for gene-transfer release [Persephonella hydrogeniphila]|uniref:Holin of 3TMs, for gene-transfer release n=1 Tax=Persephonella hydrogeniphila TaxID=198703 RepID=A0A285NSI0_9AQUI|nr:3TM-type holin [Persephonella hydrogeniphila]SNZ11927.1 Holin of 3TMs, for gene-transfer release [Persephonella hydrogeniphila]
MFNLLPIIGTVVDKVANIIDQTVEDKDLAARIKSQIQLTILTKEYENIKKELEAKRDIVVAEATGHSWLQRNWRPITMLVFVYIIAHNFIIAPLFNLKYLPIPPDMWELLKLGMGGYIIGRTVEKSGPTIVEKIAQVFKKGE